MNDTLAPHTESATQEIIRLRQLADWIAAHPEIPGKPHQVQVQHSCTVAEVLEFAAAHGVGVEHWRQDGRDYCSAQIEIGAYPQLRPEPVWAPAVLCLCGSVQS